MAFVAVALRILQIADCTGVAGTLVAAYCWHASAGVVAGSDPYQVYLPAGVA